jgi:hypothetical protein
MRRRWQLGRRQRFELLLCWLVRLSSRLDRFAFRSTRSPAPRCAQKSRGLSSERSEHHTPSCWAFVVLMARFAAPDQERLRFFMPIAERMEGLARRFAHELIAMYAVFVRAGGQIGINYTLFAQPQPNQNAVANASSGQPASTQAKCAQASSAYSERRL